MNIRRRLLAEEFPTASMYLKRFNQETLMELVNTRSYEEAYLTDIRYINPMYYGYTERVDVMIVQAKYMGTPITMRADILADRIGEPRIIHKGDESWTLWIGVPKVVKEVLLSFGHYASGLEIKF